MKCQFTEDMSMSVLIHPVTVMIVHIQIQVIMEVHTLLTQYYCLQCKFQYSINFWHDLQRRYWITIIWYHYVFIQRPWPEIVCRRCSIVKGSAHFYILFFFIHFQGLLFYGTDFETADLPLPRSTHQEWGLLHEESPKNNYLFSHKEIVEMFNHTSTFR